MDTSKVQDFYTFLDTFLARVFADFGLPGYLKGDAFDRIFPNFEGPGAFAEIVVSPRRNLT